MNDEVYSSSRVFFFLFFNWWNILRQIKKFKNIVNILRFSIFRNEREKITRFLYLVFSVYLKYRRMGIDFKTSYLIYNHIWLNLFMDHHQFFCIFLWMMTVTLAPNQNSFKNTKTTTSPSSSLVFVFLPEFLHYHDPKKTQWELDKDFFLGEKIMKKSSYFEGKNRNGHHPTRRFTHIFVTIVT